MDTLPCTGVLLKHFNSSHLPCDSSCGLQGKQGLAAFATAYSLSSCVMQVSDEEKYCTSAQAFWEGYPRITSLRGSEAPLYQWKCFWNSAAWDVEHDTRESHASDIRFLSLVGRHTAVRPASHRRVLASLHVCPSCKVTPVHACVAK